MMEEDYAKLIEDELYGALEALEEEDLPTIRRHSARAQVLAREWWQDIRGKEKVDE